VNFTGPKHFDEVSIVKAFEGRDCIPIVREAMIALSAGQTLQLPRAIIGMGPRRIFAVMPGALGLRDYFGAKLVSVFPNPSHPERTLHQGLVVLFDAEDGRPICTADAGALTQMRTAAATAVATDALSRPDSEVLTLLGCGHQAHAHVEAISKLRDLRRIIVWGRSVERARQFAERVSEQLALNIEVEPSAAAAVAEADIVCTLTSAAEPILEGSWLRPGAHVNLVGSSVPSAAEADEAVVVASRYFVESRENAGLGASEFLRAKASGAIGDDHIAAEIGEVLAGAKPGRRSNSEITVYKSLGHVVQDLAVAAAVYEHYRAEPEIGPGAAR